MYLIYQATNTQNGKRYIGFTSLSLSSRKSSHLYASKNGIDTLFAKAIRKYGWSSFAWEVLFMSWDRDHCLEAEATLIREGKTRYTGYNMCTGGRAGTGNVGPMNGMYGKTHSDESKAKFSRTATQTFKGKTYLELYGEKKAAALKESRRQSSLGKNNAGHNNPRTDPTLFTFNHNDGRSFTGTRYDFRITYDLHKNSVDDLVKSRVNTNRGWYLVK
jgi:group I intron endonuclease